MSVSYDNSSQTGGSRLQLTADEKRVFGQLFTQCDPEGLGVVTGDIARPLFERSNLPPAILGEIWQTADTENNGFLDQTGFSLALRLIGRAQHGQRLVPNIGKVPGPLPNFNGKTRPELVRNGSDSSTRIPPLTPTDRQRFAGLFERNASNGVVSGDRAKDIFLKAKLSTEKLGAIWNLTDTRGRGSLNLAEFIVAMHLIQSLLNGSLKQLPNIVPPALFEVASGRPPSRTSVRSPTMASPVFRQATGSVFGRSSPATVASQDWSIISPTEKARFDHIFNSLDKSNRGLITANEVVPFLTTSKLSDDILAQIWDLADMQNTGEFGKPEFAIAMHLVQQKLAGQELPQVVSPSLLASVTGASRQASVSQSSVSQPNTVFSNLSVTGTEATIQPPTQNIAAPVAQRTPEGSLKDLVDLNDAFSSPPPPTKREPASDTTSRPANTEVHKFVPKSEFGQSIAKEASGFSASRTASSDKTSENVQRANAESELAKISDNFNSVNAQTATVSQERQQHETNLKQLIEAKKDLEEKLTTLKATYDNEVQKVHQTKASIKQVKEENAQLSQNYSLLEASLQALQPQYEQAAAQLTTEQQENYALKEKIESVNSQTTSMKEALENTQKELERQKNMLYMSRNQMTSAEDEHGRTETALKQAETELEELTRKVKEQNEAVSRSANTQRSVETSFPGTSSAAIPIGATAAVAAAAGGYALNSNERSERSPTTDTGFSGERHDETRSAFEESFRNLEIASPSTAEPTRSSIQATEETTPQSSPPTSDYAFNTTENGTAGIPSFTLPLGRPHSASSSVQNNAPLSVRGDLDTSRPESPVFTSEPVSGMIPPDSLELPSEQSDAPDQYHEHVLTADEFRAQHQADAPAPPAPRSSVETAVPHSPKESTTDLSEGLSPTVTPLVTDQLHETSDSYEFVNAEDSDKSSREGLPQTGKSSEFLHAADDVESSEKMIGSSETEQDHRKHISHPSANETEDDDDLYVDAPSHVPGAFPESLDTSHEAKSSGSDGVFGESTRATSVSQIPAINNVEDQDTESSSDEEGPESAIPSRPADLPFTQEKTTPEPISASGNSLPPEYSEKEPSTNVADTFEFSESKNAPPPVPKKTDDLFGDAFDDLDDAEEADESNNSGVQDNFDTSFDNVGFASNNSTRGTPFSGVVDRHLSTQTQGVPSSNDEWEQLFEDFGEGQNAQLASNTDIKDAFSVSSNDKQSAPIRAVSPHSQALNELTSIGFSKPDALEALKKHNYNIAEASNYLLDKA